jgi:hypothetical protein
MVIAMKRHILISIPVLLAFFALIACGNGDNGSENDSQLPPLEVETATAPVDNAEPAELPINNEPNQTDDLAEADQPQAPPYFAYKHDDVLIEMNQNINYVTGRLGEPQGIFEAPSCAFDGTDRIFSYPGIQIYTYPVGDEDFIHTIGFFDDSIRTTEGGIRLGSNIQAALDAYGNDYEYESGMYTFTRGLTVLEFLTDNDVIMGISYRLILDI